MWVATDTERVVGVIRLRDLDGSAPNLCRLGVLSELKKSGIGKKLMDEVETFARDSGYEGICLSVAKEHPCLSKIYERRGYIFLRDKPHDLYDEIVMWKIFK